MVRLAKRTAGEITVSVTSVYNKLNGVEAQTSRALVREHLQSRPSREALSQTSLAIGGANVQRFLGFGTAHHARRGGPSKRQASKPTVPFSGSRRSLAND